MPGPRRPELIVGRSVRTTAPVRVCDVGGWTDTWFGSPGRVCSLAVGPGVRVQAALVGRPVGAPVLHLRAPDLGIDRHLAASALLAGDEHRLLGHAIEDVWERRPLHDGLGLDLHVSSAVPPGASLGTSAAVVVALLAALEALLLAPEDRHDPVGLAVRAHQVEVGRAGREAGVQDGWAAALGGANHLGINPYPDVRPRPIELDGACRAALDARLVTVVFGAHDSSEVHGHVIQAITGCGGDDHDRARRALAALARLADEAASLLEAGEVDAWSELLVAATEQQAELHPALVGAPHRRAIGVARHLGATGWKVNGAGGDGGSLTIVAGPDADPARLRAALAAADPTWRLLDLAVAPGVTVELTEP